MKYLDVTRKARELFSDFKQNARYNQIMKELKTNPSLHRKRFLDLNRKDGIGQDFYNPEILNELKKHYSLKK